MASAQVMSDSAVSSRKQDLLEAGKRRLEEFRKKKAAAKKAVSTSQPRTVGSTSDEKQTSENGPAQYINSGGAAADGRTDAVTATSGFIDHSDKSHDFAHDSGSESVSVVNANPMSNNFMSSDLLQMQPKQEGNSHYIPSLKSKADFVYPNHTDNRVVNIGIDTGEGKYTDGISSSGRNTQDGNSSFFRSTFYGVEESRSNKDITSSESLSDTYSSSNDFAAKVHGDEHASNLLYNASDSVHPSMVGLASDLGHSQHDTTELKNDLTSRLEERKPSIAVDKLSSLFSQQAPEPLSAASNFDVSGSFNGPSYSAASETHPKRTRPSFLDSLNIDRGSLASARPSSEKEKVTTMFSGSNFVASSATQNHSTTSTPVEALPRPISADSSTGFFDNTFRGQKSFEHSLDSKSHKQNEDFAALEQHIEDLTQEKFSLQRALEASKVLAESLATENSSLTESYNQQASIVNHLKAEMEQLQGEIKARLAELESFKAEYMNAQLECNAADERAKLLASEVIGLEEKTLRLRSNELKLERQLENSSAEIASFKRKLSSLEKERRDLLQTVEALQEEKKLLQTKFRRASASGISTDRGHPKKDVSTSTSDLGFDTAGADGESSEQDSSDVRLRDDTDNLLLFGQTRPAGFEDAAMSIPPDQLQMVHNINSLISEIMAEKEELVQALVAEVSTSTKLKDLNKELSQKLEFQTQRLELLTAQSMVSENISARQPTGSRIVQDSVAYADEGDEVVERVLGWIMKLFPGGPSKRRTSSRF